jgi:hypothetical protein
MDYFAEGQAGVAAEFVVAADLGAPFVMFAAAGDGVEPEAPVAGFLAAVQAEEMVVDLADEFCGQTGGTVGMLPTQIGPGDVMENGGPDPFAAETAPVARFGGEHGEGDGRERHDSSISVKGSFVVQEQPL